MKPLRIIVVGHCLVLGWGFSADSLAREWYFRPNVNIQSLYSDNIRLLTDRSRADHTDAFGFISTVSADMGVRSNKYDVGLNAAGVINRYISDLNLNSDNVFLNARSTFNITERSLFSLKGQYHESTVLNSIIDTTDVSQENTIRTTLAINPEWVYALSELTSVRLGYKHSDISYSADRSEPAGLPRFFDNTRDASSLELVNQWNKALKLRANFEALIFDTPGVRQTGLDTDQNTLVTTEINQNTTNYNFMVGLDYLFSETWTASLAGGIHVTDTEFTGTQETCTVNTCLLGLVNTQPIDSEDNSIGPLFSFKTRKTFETSAFEAGYYRETSTRGRGGLSLVDVSYLTYSQDLSDQFQIAVKLSYNDVRSLISNIRNTNQNNFTFYSTAASASWFINPQWNLTASYRYRLKESEINPSVDSNTFSLTMNYRWDAFSTQKF